ncbi:sarcosine oxidase subunit alpha family protein [Citreicella sp. C3M06]|uniref:sarcosine oxidase subunit alpha family protein n=1 Tax=Citreicella sp. C3M06 TaxID=2841564 RepID=UPI001C09004B|nr:sarcosine oxidase subunit alpha family protein [Citreicella sp. C3M06]MBU2963022.1 sarcosine oxidase subunit alpha family protein [Citreicella sp. C3M06]
MTRISGGLIDRSRTLSFTFEGKRYEGHPGDTLASALMANGVRLVGRSFKYHRPRGIFAAGSEEPNALVTLRSGARAEPNTRATTIELYDGLEAVSQNRWPSLAFDALGVNDLASPFFAAGFYYKTFMWPKAFWEKLYEPLIRRAAGLGALGGEPDPDAYDKGFLHCDLLIIGGGATGLAAALTAGRAGASVILADEDMRLGGRLLMESHALNDAPAVDWVQGIEAELESLPNVRILRRTTIFGSFDHGIFGALERVGDHLLRPETVRQTLWRITAKRSILAAGATERHIPFASNDRPGILLGGALRAYVNRWGVTPQAKDSDRIAIFTDNDDGHRTAIDLVAKGIPVLAVIDAREDAQRLGEYQLYKGATVTGTQGRLGLSSIDITQNGLTRTLECAVLGVSGGWNPNLHLASHHRGRPVWSQAHSAFLPPEDLPQGMAVAGAAAGHGSTHAALRSGAQIAAQLSECKPAELPLAEDAPHRQTPLWHVPGKTRAWVDFQNDVTVKDIALAHRENMRPVEHLKRWTTLGMATDQGKTANVTALAVMAELTGKTIAQTGTTIFRPPYTPVALGALGGGDSGVHFRPTRLTPTHPFAVQRGAPFVEVGQWLRAQYFPLKGETHWRESVDREVLAVRSGVGLCDVTTLGKIDVQGTDAGDFLNRIYCNAMASLKVGKVRYGLMLREDGFAYDDGTCARLGEQHYVVTTTTANAGLVYRQMEFARQCLWPDLDVQLISTTDAWAQIAVAGPKSRELLSRVVEADLSNEAFPFMACAETRVCGLRARLFRISFSGELAYEIAVPTRYGNALMARLMEVGADLGVTPYGTEALGVLRIEKGHATGAELNGQASAQMLGMGRMVSTKKDSIGAVMSRREGLMADTRRLVGLMPQDPQARILAGGHLFAPEAERKTETDLGWVTSACWSPHLNSYIALGFLTDGEARLGETVIVANPLEGDEAPCKIVSPHFIDPEGGRLRD